MEKLTRKAVLLASLFGILFGTLGGGLTTALILYFNPVSSSQEPAVIQYEGGSYGQVVEKTSPAVVSIVAMKDLSQYGNQSLNFGPFQFFQTPQETQPTQPDTEEDDSGDASNLSEVSSGTGFIVTADGLVVTNKHVVSDEDAEYVVILDDGTQLDAEVLAKDSLNDIALVQIRGDDDRLGELPTLEFGDSDAMQVGDPVLAIGNALGEYSNTTTSGIISARDRQIMASGAGFGSENLVNLIQTDAAINPGNSGGPLLNLAGQVVGMNTAIDTTASGIGFAIPANDIAAVLKSYQENGEIVRPFFGVRYVPVTDGLKEHFNLDVDHGAYVIGDPEQGPGVVEDSPADKAGIQEGDVILTVGGKDLTDSYTLQNAVAAYTVWDEVAVQVSRDGKTLDLKVVLEKSPY